MFELITPVILTFNEAPNIGRTLSKLAWAQNIVVVDSFSQDETLNIVKQFPQTSVYQRAFDNHAAQWNYALTSTGITTAWVLALDADYVLSDELVDEIRQLQPTDINGYEARFAYCINGQCLRGAAYPPATVLYQRKNAEYHQDGHTQRIKVAGRIDKLHATIYHDDRKPLTHWVQSQIRYMHLESEKLLKADRSTLGWSDRLRLLRVIAPFVMLVYCLFYKGAILNGRAGIYYAFQRMFAELLLSLCLFQRDMTLE